MDLKERIERTVRDLNQLTVVTIVGVSPDLSDIIYPDEQDAKSRREMRRAALRKHLEADGKACATLGDLSDGDLITIIPSLDQDQALVDFHKEQVAASREIIRGNIEFIGKMMDKVVELLKKQGQP